ncbi:MULTISPECIES: hypothetical protein [Kitasatospora]|uniref:Uncharacterized protein n=1 Tax=Kitasatospora setae (strain ATCC 33774 / DSM 43861 / JCM 3304 / KCC A-0304 / NBRC 14216 / KM-6054) TaxID=452652 RepID=E4N498_KITSK|nr:MULTISPECIES: hypothetical protein [Kitasatospora]BAJ26029.1 hypothetical protein KSE_01780 [Kitasatospora setae KM-6054]
MRLLFVCQDCGCHYLVPTSLDYPDGGRASAVWCSSCQRAAAERGAAEPAELAAVAVLLALRALKAAVAVRPAPSDTPPARPDRRPTRPAISSRGRTHPTAARTRLA